MPTRHRFPNVPFERPPHFTNVGHSYTHPPKLVSGCEVSHFAFLNKSLRPTKIDVGSRSARFFGWLRVVTSTATPVPAGKGSDTISNRSPYICMWWEEP